MAEGRGLELTLQNITVLVVFTLVLFQAFGLALGDAVGLDIKLGPVFVLFPLALATILATATLKKLIGDQPIQKQDIFAIIVIGILAFVALFFLRDMIPEIFAESLTVTQSMLGFG